MNTSTDDIGVSKIPGRNTYRIIIEDDLCISSDGIATILHTNRDTLTFSIYEATQLAGALIALATLTTDGKYKPREALIPVVETLNTIRKKAGEKPLIDINNLIENP